MLALKSIACRSYAAGGLCGKEAVIAVIQDNAGNHAVFACATHASGTRFPTEPLEEWIERRRAAAAANMLGAR